MSGETSLLKRGWLVSSSMAVLVMVPTLLAAQQPPKASPGSAPSQTSRWNRLKNAVTTDFKSVFSRDKKSQEEQNQGKAVHKKRKRSRDVVQTAAQQPALKRKTPASRQTSTGQSEIAKQLEALYAKDGMPAPSMDLSSLPKTTSDARLNVENRSRQAKRPGAAKPPAPYKPAPTAKPLSPPAGRTQPVAPPKKPSLLHRVFGNRFQSSKSSAERRSEPPTLTRWLDSRRATGRLPTTKPDRGEQTRRTGAGSPAKRPGLLPDFLSRRNSKEAATQAKPIATAQTKPITPKQTAQAGNSTKIPNLDSPSPKAPKAETTESKQTSFPAWDAALENLFPESAAEPEEDDPFADFVELESSPPQAQAADSPPALEPPAFDDAPIAEQQPAPSDVTSSPKVTKAENEKLFLPTPNETYRTKSASSAFEQPVIQPASQTSKEPQIRHSPIEGILPARAQEIEIPDAPPAMAPPIRNANQHKRIERRGMMNGLKGFCLVQLRDGRRLVDALTEHKSTHDGRHYYFSSADAKQSFDANPTKYIPAAGGNDVVVLAEQNRQREGTLDHAVWYEGKLYLFHSQASHTSFMAAPKFYMGR